MGRCVICAGIGDTMCAYMLICCGINKIFSTVSQSIGLIISLIVVAYHCWYNWCGVWCDICC